MEIHYYKDDYDTVAHKETVEKVHWADGFETRDNNEIVFKRVSDDAEVSIPFGNFICVVSERTSEIKKTLTDLDLQTSVVLEKLGRTELLAQLAEEAAELSQAALKLRRALDGKSPTPVAESEAMRSLQEELADVLLCATIVGFNEADVALTMRAKTARWTTRLKRREKDRETKQLNHSLQHGQWVKPVPGDGENYCSVCKAPQPWFYGNGYQEYDFCPYCGAKMDKEEG